MRSDYSIIVRKNQRGITCHDCGLTSFSLGDIENRYCGKCKNFHNQVLAVELDRVVILNKQLPEEDLFELGTSELVNTINVYKALVENIVNGFIEVERVSEKNQDDDLSNDIYYSKKFHYHFYTNEFKKVI